MFGARIVQLEPAVAHHTARVGRALRAVRIRWLVESPVMNRGGAATTLGVMMTAAVAVAGCGTTDKASRETLPPIRTTIAITTTTSTTVAPGQQFYVIKPGDTLGMIAASLNVTVQSIVDLNGLANPDDIQAGQTIEIPSGITVIDDLPVAPTTT
jgi:LysM repeat protein